MTQEDPDRRKEPLKVSFSLPQLAGSALAAATAALIGSQLGVAGTIAGAAVASVVGGVAGTLYSAGLDRTHRRVTEAIRRGYERVREADDVETQLLPAAGDGAGGTEWNRPHSVPVEEDDGVETTAVDLRPVPAADEPARPSRRRRFLVGTAVSVATIFLATMVMITVVEFGIGRSLDGSSTTTVGGARRPTAAATTPKPKPTPTPSPSTSATTTAPASPTPEPTPSASASEQITPEPTPSPSVVLTPVATAS